MVLDLLPWPLRTVRLSDGDESEIFVWTGWEYPDAVGDLPNVNSAWLYRLRVDGSPATHYARPGANLRTWIHEVLELYDAGFP